MKHSFTPQQCSLFPDNVVSIKKLNTIVPQHKCYADFIRIEKLYSGMRTHMFYLSMA